MLNEKWGRNATEPTPLQASTSRSTTEPAAENVRSQVINLRRSRRVISPTRKQGPGRAPHYEAEPSTTRLSVSPDRQPSACRDKQRAGICSGPRQLRITDVAISQDSGEYGGQDSNLRPAGYEPAELPLLHPRSTKPHDSLGEVMRLRLSEGYPFRTLIVPLGQEKSTAFLLFSVRPIGTQQYLRRS